MTSKLAMRNFCCMFVGRWVNMLDVLFIAYIINMENGKVLYEDCARENRFGKFTSLYIWLKMHRP